MKILLLFAFLVAFYLQEILSEPVTLYNPNNQVCCNGSVHSFFPESTSSCCGTELFDFTKALCCDGKIENIPSQENQNFNSYSCCKDKIYNYMTSLCCNGEIFDNPQEKTESFFSCCGGKPYNADNFLCCGEQLHKKTSNDMGCCGNETFSYNDHLCCYETPSGNAPLPQFPKTQLVKMTSNTSTCCGLDKVYEWDKEMCCGNSVLPRPQESNTSFPQCCGDQVIDFNKQLCCDRDTVVDRPSTDYFCCGDKSYNEKEEVCCYADTTEKMKTIKRTGPNTVCCDGKPYEDDGKNICCDNQIIPITNSSQNMCCTTFKYFYAN